MNKAMMQQEMVGPILLARGVAGERWQLSALLLRPDRVTPEPLATAEGNFSARLLYRAEDRPNSQYSLWRYDFSYPLDRAGSSCAYFLGGQSYQVQIPDIHQHIRLAYSSCNEFGRQGRAVSTERWRHLLRRHDEAPLHLLLHGGDQLYADDIFQHLYGAEEWAKIRPRDWVKQPWNESLAEEAMYFYLQRYQQVWGQAELRPLLASVPSLMMWDDHDIFDGFGSLPDSQQQSALVQGVFKVARKAFCLFQLGANDDALPGHVMDDSGASLGWALRFGTLGIIAPDLRSERRRDRVMGPMGWRSLAKGLAEMHHCRHVLFLSSVPLMGAGLNWLERLICLIPGQQLYQDDLRDQWRSFAHREEWHKLLQVLFSQINDNRQMTAISGEIHLGAMAELRHGGRVLPQLIASGIAHQPPPPRFVQLLEWLAEKPVQLEGGYDGMMLKLPGLDRYYLAAENWLELDWTPHRLQARWHPSLGQSVVFEQLMNS